MPADNNGQNYGNNPLPRSRISPSFQVLRDQSTSSSPHSPSRPDLAIDTTSAPSPYGIPMSDSIGAHAPPPDSNSIPSTSNTANQPRRRHSRRVQWAINTTSASAPPDALQPQNQAENVAHRLSSLDELALDPTAFATLQAALERHSSNPHHAPTTTISPSDIPYTSSPPHSYPQSRASESTSPSPSASQSPYSRTPGEPDTATAITGASTLNDDDAGLAYIPPGETEGLPAPINRAPTFQREADLLVRAHSRTVFGFRWGSHSSSSKSKAKKEDEKRMEENVTSGEIKVKKPGAPHGNKDVADGGHAAKERIDVERRGEPMVSIGMGLGRPRFPDYEHGDGSDIDGRLSGSTTAASSIHGGTGGILSSLLALYGQQQQHSVDQNERTDDRDRRKERKDRHGPTSSTGTDRDRKHKDSQGQKRDPSKEEESPSKHRRTNPVKPALHLVTEKLLLRPAAARSGGGVFGGLIASTGNITGAATPAASTIAPTVGRPGYHLSRYSWDNGKIMRKMDKETLKQHKRSRSAGQPSLLGLSQPTTPITGHNTPTSACESLTGATVPVATVSEPPSPNHRHPLASQSQAMNTSTTTSGSKSDDAVPSKRTSWADLLHVHGLPAPTQLFSGSRPASPVSDMSAEWHGKEAIRDRRGAKRHKEKRKREEIYITMHVAEILQRQEFILKLTRSLMMFGAPSHRLEAQIQATAKVLDIQLSCMYLPNVMLFSFDDAATHTSETKVLKQTANLDLGKLHDVYMLYWHVIYDQIGVTEASADLDILMRKRPIYKGWVTVLIGGLCAAFITPISFSGSFIDACIVFPLGCLLVVIQNFASTNELYTNVFEITVATCISFLAAALASTHRFCYAAVASGGVVLVLLGYIVLTGSLELASRNIISGAVRIGYSVIYALYLGFGLAIGGEIYHQISGQAIFNGNDYTCALTHSSTGPWYQRTASVWWAFLCVPMFSLFLSLRNQAPIKRKELPISILIACAGWVANHFASKKFVNRSDITSAIGSFAVGLMGNIYGRISYGNAFVVMITGILFQVPSGLANGGLLAFSNESVIGSSVTYSQGFLVAEQLISVAIGLTVGLFVSTVVVYPFRSNRRGAGLFSL